MIISSQLSRAVHFVPSGHLTTHFIVLKNKAAQKYVTPSDSDVHLQKET
jgi:hypothetical protein